MKNVTLSEAPLKKTHEVRSFVLGDPSMNRLRAIHSLEKHCLTIARLEEHGGKKHHKTNRDLVTQSAYARQGNHICFFIIYLN